MCFSFGLNSPCYNLLFLRFKLLSNTALCFQIHISCKVIGPTNQTVNCYKTPWKWQRNGPYFIVCYNTLQVYCKFQVYVLHTLTLMCTRLAASSNCYIASEQNLEFVYLVHKTAWSQRKANIIRFDLLESLSWPTYLPIRHLTFRK